MPLRNSKKTTTQQTQEVLNSDRFEHIETEKVLPSYIRKVVDLGTRIWTFYGSL